MQSFCAFPLTAIECSALNRVQRGPWFAVQHLVNQSIQPNLNKMLSPQSPDPHAADETHSNAGRPADSRITLKATVLRMQIVNGAIIMGVVTICAVILMLSADPPDAKQGNIMLVVGCTVWTLSTLIALVWPMLSFTQHDWSDESKKSLERVIQDADRPIPSCLQPLLKEWNTKQFVRVALIEGAAIVCLILWLISREITLLVLVGVSISLMLVTFPTLKRMREWMEHVAEKGS